MGQKTHPYAFRIGIVNDWKSRWFNSKDYKTLVNQDYIKDGKISVSDYVKSADPDLIVTGFQRLALG